MVRTCVVCKLVQPTYNTPDNKTPTHCAKCALDGMVDVRHQKCVVCKLTRPTYNIQGSTTATHCKKCKTDDMIDIKHKLCIVCNTTRPHYNTPNSTTPTHCTKCKLDNMIDIVNKICVICNITRANFNNPDLKTPTHCAKCALDGMVDVRNKRCIVCKKIQPNYGTIDNKVPTHCVRCKLDNMIDVRNKRCKTFMCDVRSSDKYDGYCMRCYMYTFPDKPVARNYKTKELTVVHYVKSTFPNLTIVTDKRVEYGCSRRRPDVFIDLYHQVIIVEIDENQHIQYDCSCENKRIMQLSQDINYRPLVFIRFNPDSYKCKDKNISSCWTVNKLGICVVKKLKQDEWDERLKQLSNTIKYWLANKVDKTIEVVQLYYDE